MTSHIPILLTATCLLKPVYLKLDFTNTDPDPIFRGSTCASIRLIETCENKKSTTV